MVQVNLLSKKKGFKKQRNAFSLVGMVVFGLVAGFFLVQVVMVVWRYYSVNRKLSEVRQETKTLSAEMLRDNEKLNRFILTKFILSEITRLRAKQFDYSSYLDQIQNFVPAGNEIASVDFQTQGFISIRVTSNTSGGLSTFEKLLRSADITKTDFNSVVIKSVTRDEGGLFKTDLLFGIKKVNGG
jgi:hypothetical protein